MFYCCKNQIPGRDHSLPSNTHSQAATQARLPGAFPTPSQLSTAQPALAAVRKLKHLVSSDFNLVNVWALRPLIPGNELREMLSLASGPSVGKWMEIQMDWMLSNPDANKDDLEKALKGMKIKCK